MLDVMEKVQMQCEHDLMGIQGLQTFHANSPKDVERFYEVTCSDRRKSLQGPGVIYQAINLKSPEVRLCNWTINQKKATIDVLVSLTSLDT